LGDEGLTITGSGNIDVQNGTISGVSITASTGFYSENGTL
jgi:adhesin HecA-like repeat protein